MNAVAEGLTGWAERSIGEPVSKVFNIINELTRQTAGKTPSTGCCAEGVIVALANHTVLIRKHGTKIPIDDSGAPIRDSDGKSVVWCSFSETYRA